MRRGEHLPRRELESAPGPGCAVDRFVTLRKKGHEIEMPVTVHVRGDRMDDAPDRGSIT